MIPVQEITIKSYENRRFEAFIKKPTENIFKWWLFGYDPKTNFSGGYSSKTVHNSSQDAFDEMVDFVVNHLNERKDDDSIEYIDNPCNCELLNESLQKESIAKKRLSFSVRVNGKPR